MGDARQEEGERGALGVRAGHSQKDRRGKGSLDRLDVSMDGSIGYVDRVNMMQGGPLRVCKTAIARINGLAHAHDFKPGMLARMAAQGDGRNHQCRGKQR